MRGTDLIARAAISIVPCATPPVIVVTVHTQRGYNCVIVETNIAEPIAQNEREGIGHASMRV